jgi:hypothetical protein
LATGGVDGIGRLWEYPTLTSLETFDCIDKEKEERINYGQVQAVDILDDYFLVVREKAALLYDFGSSTEPLAVVTVEEASSSSTALPSSFRCGAFGKGKLDGYILVAGGDQVRLYSLPKLSLYSICRVRAKAVTCIKQTNDGRTIAYGCSDGSVGFLSSGLSHISFIKDCHAFAVSSVCFGNDFLISGSVGGTLALIPKTRYTRNWGFVLVILLSILVAYLAYLYYIHQKISSLIFMNYIFLIYRELFK